MTIQTKIPSNLEMTISAEAQKNSLLLSLLVMIYLKCGSILRSSRDLEKRKKLCSGKYISGSITKDARSDIVEEIDYLYWEIRAIKNILIDHVYEPDVENLEVEKTPQQEFAEAIASLKELDAFEDSEKTFLFKKHVDPILIAYLSMDQDQRKAIQQ